MGLSVSPNPLVFADTPVSGGPGEGCPDFCDYQMVTVSNDGAQPEELYTAVADTGYANPFWCTWGGTFNLSPRTLQPGESKTLQWGFRPSKPGKSQATGIMYFVSGETASVKLVGKGKKGGK